MIKSTTKKTKIKEWCNLCIKQRVYLLGGGMRHVYLEPDDIKCMSISISRGKIRGAALSVNQRYSLQIFVKKEYRRNGIGKKLINIIKQRSSDSFDVYCDNKNKDFWRSFNSKKIR